MIKPALRLPAVLFSSFIVHTFCIWIFAVAFCLLAYSEGTGRIVQIDHDIFEYLYFSATTYTTVGYGDLIPIGNIRLLSAAEALCGLLLIAWTASLGYGEINNFMNNNKGE